MKIDIRIIDDAQSRKLPFWKSVSRILVVPAILIGPGVIVDSGAMQWAGFCILLFFCAMLLCYVTFRTMTIEEARAKLDELEAEPIRSRKQ